MSSCNGSLGREIIYTYDTNSKITDQLTAFSEIIDYKIAGIFYEGNQLIIQKDGKLYFSDLTAAYLTEIYQAQMQDTILQKNKQVIKHLTEADIYTSSPEEKIISVIYDKQIWTYKDDKLNIIIEKRYADDYDCNIYVTHIFTNDYSLFTTGNANTESLTASKTYKASYISGLYQMIYAQNTDTFVYTSNNSKGIIIRQGKVVRDVLSDDMITYFSDGSMKVYESEDLIDAQTLIDNDATTSFSFGPILVEDYGIYYDCVTVKLADRNPRSAIGYVEPGHYVMVASD